MLSLSSLEGFHISKLHTGSGADESTATPGTVVTNDFFGVKGEDTLDHTTAAAASADAPAEPSLSNYFYIIQSQHPLTSAEMQAPPMKTAAVNIPQPAQSLGLPPHAGIRGPPMHQMPPYSPQQPQIPAQSELLVQPPPWLRGLLDFRCEPRKPALISVKSDLNNLKQSEDALCVALLRAIQLIEHDGPVKAKLKISKMGPASELKDLINMTNELALQCFENLPPGLACLRTDEILTTTSSCSAPCEEIELSSMMHLQHNQQHLTAHIPAHEETSYGSIPDYMDPMAALAQVPNMGGPGAADMALDYYAWSEPAARMSLMPPSQQTALLPSLGLMGAGGAQGAAGAADMMCAAMVPGSAPPGAEGLWQPPDMWSAQAAGQMYQQASPYVPYPYGLPYQRLNEARRKCGIDSSDLFPTTKKGPSVGDRPLTPPAQGWYAKYSSGVTGVVWDRVHQAWVVSWTLAGKRTFRHFTCKSYGGFDKAREAAIEFRLARNREIAAYNKRSKDKN